MGLALAGVAILAFKVALARWTAARLVAHGQSPRQAWLWLVQAPFTWMGVILVVYAVSPTAAAVLFGLVFLVTVVFFTVVVARGVRGLPEFARQVRRIGDPDAWRGIEHR